MSRQKPGITHVHVAAIDVLRYISLIQVMMATLDRGASVLTMDQSWKHSTSTPTQDYTSLTGAVVIILFADDQPVTVRGPLSPFSTLRSSYIWLIVFSNIFVWPSLWKDGAGMNVVQSTINETLSYTDVNMNNLFLKICILYLRQKHTFTLQELRVYSDVGTSFPRILWECQWSRAMCILKQTRCGFMLGDPWL